MKFITLTSLQEEWVLDFIETLYSYYVFSYTSITYTQEAGYFTLKVKDLLRNNVELMGMSYVFNKIILVRVPLSNLSFKETKESFIQTLTGNFNIKEYNSFRNSLGSLKNKIEDLYE